MLVPPPSVAFITWTDQWRADRIADATGTTPLLPAPFALRWPWPLRYLVQGLATMWCIARLRPQVVVFTNPPSLAGVPLILVARLLGTRVWADSHSGPWTDPRWMRFGPINRWVLRHCDGALFHSPALLEAYGHEARQAVLSWTPPLSDLRAHDGPPAESEPYVLGVMSYQVDEPVSAILEAARLAPEVNLRLTGRAPDEVRRAAPPNVEFTGFVPVATYEALVRNAAAVLCLSTWHDAMQQGIADAVEAGVPGITGDNETMRAWRAATATCELVNVESAPAIATAMRSATSTDRAPYDEAGRAALLDRSHRQFDDWLQQALAAR